LRARLVSLAALGEGEQVKHMSKADDEHFVRVELPAALRAIYARASINKVLAGKLLFDQLAYIGPDATKKSSHADVLKALAFSFKVINANSHADPVAARRILVKLERAQ
jgi:hypothetical protein